MLSRFRQAKADVWTMRRLFPEAERLAHVAGRAEPGPDDLVLAALDLPDGIARRALAACGVSARDLRAATTEVREVVPPGDAAAGPVEPDGAPTGPYRSEPSMRMTFHIAVGIAKAQRSYVRSGDLLLAALQAPDGVVTLALDRLGVDPDAVADAVARDEIGGEGR